MKKLALFTLLSFFALSSFTQGLTNEEKAEKSTKKLTKTLGLDAKQSAKLMEISLEKFKEFDRLDEEMINEPVEKRYEKMSVTVELDKKLYPLLSKGQLKTLKKLRKEQTMKIKN